MQHSLLPPVSLDVDGSFEVPIERTECFLHELLLGFGIWIGINGFSGEANFFRNAGSQRW